MFDEKKQVQIQEERGLWKASSFVHKIADRLARKNLPLSVRYLLEAHRMIFSETNEKYVAGKYRRNDPFIKRIDGTKLTIPHWSEVPNQMAILEEELKNKTSQISPPKTTKDYTRIIDIAVKTSHRLACMYSPLS